MNTEATHHITRDLENLTITYQGSNNVQVGNGKVLVIKHIGSSHVITLSQSFILNNIFHCPNALANLLLV